MFTSLSVIEERLVYTNLATGCPKCLWDSTVLYERQTVSTDTLVVFWDVSLCGLLQEHLWTRIYGVTLQKMSVFIVNTAETSNLRLIWHIIYHNFSSSTVHILLVKHENSVGCIPSVTEHKAISHNWNIYYIYMFFLIIKPTRCAKFSNLFLE